MRSHLFGEANKLADILESLVVGTDEQILYLDDLPCSLLEAIRNGANQCMYTCMQSFFD